MDAWLTGDPERHSSDLSVYLSSSESSDFLKRGFLEGSINRIVDRSLVTGEWVKEGFWLAFADVWTLAPRLKECSGDKGATYSMEGWALEMPSVYRTRLEYGAPINGGIARGRGLSISIVTSPLSREFFNHFAGCSVPILFRFFI